MTYEEIIQGAGQCVNDSTNSDNVINYLKQHLPELRVARKEDIDTFVRRTVHHIVEGDSSPHYIGETIRDFLENHFKVSPVVTMTLKDAEDWANERYPEHKTVPTLRTRLYLEKINNYNMVKRMAVIAYHKHIFGIQPADVQQSNEEAREIHRAVLRDNGRTEG